MRVQTMLATVAARSLPPAQHSTQVLQAQPHRQQGFGILRRMLRAT